MFNDVDWDDTSAAEGFEPIPEGWYTAIIESVEDKETKAGTGRYLKCTLQVVDGDFQGRKVWANFNYQNPSAKAQAIGKIQLRALAKSVGLQVKEMSAPEELLGKPFAVQLTVRSATENYGASNDVKDFKELSSKNETAALSTHTALAGDDVPF